MFNLETKQKLRILDFDVEARPLSFWGKRPSIEITAIAWCFADDLGTMEVYLLGQTDPIEIFNKFVEQYNKADIVTGHNIRGYDLPQISGALLEYNLPKLQSKFTQDTFFDLRKRGDIPASQEYLLDLFGVGKKVHMSQHDWRKSNRLLKEGIEKTKERVVGDVYDHMRLRVEMIKRDLLKPPKMWHP